MKYFLILTILLFSFEVYAQDTLLITQVDTPPVLPLEKISGAKPEDDQEKLLLRGIYNTIRYPSTARYYGVRAAVEITYLIDTNGVVGIEKSRAFPLEEAARLNLPKNETVVITAFATRSVNGGPRQAVAAPKQTKNEKRRAKAFTALEEAAAAAILALPDFSPGTNQGKAVVVRSTKLFTFSME